MAATVAMAAMAAACEERGGGHSGKDLERMCTLFLAAICQAKEHIEQLEVAFSQDVYPALIQQREADMADLERERGEEERRWREEKAALVAERDAAAREREAADAAVARLEQEKSNLEAKERSLRRKCKALQEDADAKRVALRSLQARYNFLKKEAGSAGRAKEAAEFGDRIDGELVGVGAGSRTVAIDRRVEEARALDEAAAAAIRGTDEAAGSRAAPRIDEAAGSRTVAAIERLVAGSRARRVDKGDALAEEKRSWRSTRAEKGGARDPHDDFLNTPQELALQRIAAEKKNTKNNDEKPDEPAAEKKNTKNNDEKPDELAAVNFVPDTLGIEWDNPVFGQPEVDDVCLEPEVDAFKPKADTPKKRARSTLDGWIAAAGRSKAAPPPPRYKFNEPVRKKAEREALKGVECRQCKKFYDAVGHHGDDTSRCEHHNEVSRHRYKYVPPSTPEGFWNIGFSET